MIEYNKLVFIAEKTLHSSFNVLQHRFIRGMTKVAPYPELRHL